MPYLFSTLLLVVGLLTWSLGFRALHKGWVRGKYGTIYTREHTPINFWTQAGGTFALGTVLVGVAFYQVIARIFGAE